MSHILSNLRLALTNQALKELADKVFQIFIFQSEEKIKELRKENEQYWETQIEQPSK